MVPQIGTLTSLRHVSCRYFKGDVLIAMALGSRCLTIYHGSKLLQVLECGDVHGVCWGEGEVLYAFRRDTILRWVPSTEDVSENDVLPVEEDMMWEPKSVTILDSDDNETASIITAISAGECGLVVATTSTIRLLEKHFYSNRLSLPVLSAPFLLMNYENQKISSMEWGPTGALSQFATIFENIGTVVITFLKKVDIEDETSNNYTTEVASQVSLPHPSPVTSFSYLESIDDSVVFMTLSGQRIRFWNSTQQTSKGTFSFFLTHSILIAGNCCNSSLWLPPVNAIQPSPEVPPPPFGMVRHNMINPERQVVISTKTHLQVFSVTIGSLPRRGVTSKLVSIIEFRSQDANISKILFCSSSRKLDKDKEMISMLTLSETTAGYDLKHFLSKGFVETSPPLLHYTLSNHSKELLIQTKNSKYPIIASTDGSSVIFWNDTNPSGQLTWLCSTEFSEKVSGLSWSSKVSKNDTQETTIYSLTLYVGVGSHVVPVAVEIDVSPVLSFFNPITSKDTPPSRHIDPQPTSSFSLPSTPAAYRVVVQAKLPLPVISATVEPKEEPTVELVVPSESSAASKYAHLLPVKSVASKVKDEEGEPQAGKSAIASKYAHLLGGGSASQETKEEEETSGKSAMANKYAHLLGSASEEPAKDSESENPTGKSAMTSKYAHLLGGSTPEKAEGGGSAGKSAMAGKYAHLLGGGSALEEKTKEDEDDNSHQTSGKSEMANKYAHLTGGTSTGGSESANPTDGKSAMANKYAHLLGGVSENTSTEETSQPTDGKSEVANKYAHLLKDPLKESEGGTGSVHPTLGGVSEESVRETKILKEVEKPSEPVEIDLIVHMQPVELQREQFLAVVSRNGHLVMWSSSSDSAAHSAGSKLSEGEAPVVQRAVILQLHSALIVAYVTSEGLFATLAEYDCEARVLSCKNVTVEGPPETHPHFRNQISELSTVDYKVTSVFARVNESPEVVHKYDIEVTQTHDEKHKLSWNSVVNKTDTIEEEPLGEIPYHPSTLSHWLQSDNSWKASRSLRGLLVSLKSISHHYKEHLFGSNLVGSTLVAAAGNDEVEDPQQYFGMLGWPITTTNNKEEMETIRVNEGSRLEPFESEELTDLLGRASVHALSTASAVDLLALVELEKHVDGDLGCLDEPAVRYLHSVRLREYANHHKKQSSTEVMSFESVSWALWSDGTDSLYQTILKVKNNRLSWDDFLNLKIPLWLKSNKLFREVCDQQANQLYQQSKNPRDAAMLLVALGKMTVLSTLFKVHGETRLSEFFSRDFSEEKNRTIASKNALAAFSRGSVLLGCAYFLLAGRYEDAARAIIQKLRNWPLSYAICRLADDSPLLGPISETFLKQQLEEVQNHQSDPWAEHIIKWLLRDYTSAGEIAWKVTCGQSDLRYEAMTAVSNLPQLFVIKKTLFSPARQARLLLRSVCDSLDRQNYLKALTYFRKFVDAKREADNDVTVGGNSEQDNAALASGTMDFGNWGMAPAVDNQKSKKEVRKAEKRRLREAKKEQQAIDSGVMDFGGMWGGDTSAKKEEDMDSDSSEDSEEEDGDISQHIVNSVKWRLSVGILKTQLAILSSNLCLSPSLETWESVSQRWKSDFAAVTTELEISSSYQKAIIEQLKSAYLTRSDMIAVVLIQVVISKEISALETIPHEVIEWCVNIFNSITLLGVKSRLPDQPHHKSTSHVTNQLCSLIHMFASKSSTSDAAILFRALCANLVVDAWESRNVSKMVALLQYFSEREADSREKGYLVGAMNRIFADKKKMDSMTLEAWEDQKYDNQSKKSDDGVTSLMTNSLLTLVAHCLSFRIRSILGGGRAANVANLQFYASCLGNSAHILHSFPLRSNREVYYGLSPLTESPTLPTSLLLLRGLKYACRYSLRTDLTGYTVRKNDQDVPPQLHDLLWSLNSVCRYNEGLKKLLTILQKKNLVTLSGHQKSAMVSGSCSIREVVSLFQNNETSEPTRVSLSESTSEDHKSKKGIYSFLVDDIHTKLAIICEVRGVHEIGLQLGQQVSQISKRSSSSHVKNSPQQGPVKSKKEIATSPPATTFYNSDDESHSSLSGSFTRGRNRTVRSRSFRSEKLLLELSAEVQKSDSSSDYSANKIKHIVGHPKLPLHATACTDTVHLYSTGSGTNVPLKTYKASKEHVITKLAFSLNGSVLAAGDNKGYLSCWRIDPSTSSDASILPSPVCVTKDKEPISSVFFLDEGTIVGIVGGGKGPNQLILHDLMHLRHGGHPGIATVNLPHEMEATCAAVIMPRRDVIICGRRGEIALYDVTNIRFPVYHVCRYLLLCYCFHCKRL